MQTTVQLKDLNAGYTTLNTRNDLVLIDEWPLALSGSVDSFVAGVQQPAGWTLALPQGNEGFAVNVQRFPDAQAAYMQLNTIQVGSRQLTADAAQTVMRIDYVEPGQGAGGSGRIRPLLLYDNRNFIQSPVPLMRVFPLPILDPGLKSLGSFQATVLSTSSVGAHPITYDIIVSIQILYVLDEPRTDAAVVGALANLHEQASQHTSLLANIGQTLLSFIPGNEPVEGSDQGEASK